MIDALCLINMNARIYDQTLGRFYSADSIVPNSTNSQSLNRFAYVNNRPLSFFDPSGNSDCDKDGCSDLILPVDPSLGSLGSDFGGAEIVTVTASAGPGVDDGWGNWGYSTNMQDLMGFHSFEGGNAGRSRDGRVIGVARKQQQQPCGDGTNGTIECVYVYASRYQYQLAGFVLSNSSGSERGVCRPTWLAWGNTLRAWAPKTARVGVVVVGAGFVTMIAGGGPETPVGAVGAGAMEVGSYINLGSTIMDVGGGALQWYGGAGPGNFIDASMTAAASTALGLAGLGMAFPKSGNGALGGILWGANIDTFSSLTDLNPRNDPAPAHCAGQ